MKSLGRITVYLRNGQPLTAEHPLAALYQPYRPVKKDYRQKFDRLTGRLAPKARDKLWRHVMNVADAHDVSRWCRELERLMQIPVGR